MSRRGSDRPRLRSKAVMCTVSRRRTSSRLPFLYGCMPRLCEARRVHPTHRQIASCPLLCCTDREGITTVAKKRYRKLPAVPYTSTRQMMRLFVSHSPEHHSFQPAHGFSRCPLVSTTTGAEAIFCADLMFVSVARSLPIGGNNRPATRAASPTIAVSMIKRREVFICESFRILDQQISRDPLIGGQEYVGRSLVIIEDDDRFPFVGTRIVAEPVSARGESLRLGA